jgi:hypothetical protein
MAVPMTVKMPEPMTAPMPSAVSDHGPRVFLRQCSGSSDSRISLSMDLRASSWLGRAVLLFAVETWFHFWSGRLPLGHAARQLLQLFLVFSAGSGPLRLGGGLFAGGAFYFLPFQLVFNPGRVCHL